MLIDGNKMKMILTKNGDKECQIHGEPLRRLRQFKDSGAGFVN
jgi:hypothetical protein